MTDALLAQLADFGALGLFAAFLLYQHFSMQKRLDALVEKFQQQLDKINEDYDSRTEKLRERYDTVIAGKEAVTETIRVSLVAVIEENARKLDTAIAKISES